MSEVKDCSKGGVHMLPAGEQAWPLPRVNKLVAAGLDGCVPCQAPLMDELSETLTQEFGQLFTSWVMVYVQAVQSFSFLQPTSILEAMGSGESVLSEPAKAAARSVQLIWHGSGFLLKAEVAVDVLTLMSRQERRQVLDDVLDGIVGEMAVMGGNR